MYTFLFRNMHNNMGKDIYRMLLKKTRFEEQQSHENQTLIIITYMNYIQLHSERK